MNALSPDISDSASDSPSPGDRPQETPRESTAGPRYSQPWLVVEGVSGERAVIVGADAVFDLICRANAALGADDPRKMTAGWLARIETIRDMILDFSATADDTELGAARRELARAWEEMAAVLRAIVGGTESEP